MKRILLSVIMVLLMGATIMAQKTINGTVTDTEGEPLIGANVYLADDPSVGTITDFDGQYELDIPEDAEMLEVSFTGFETKQVELGTSDSYDITLAEGVQLNEAVVTALGITREEKSLGYSTQEVDGEETTRVKDANFVNSLSGKVSGVNIQSSGTMGGSSNVLIRGYKSLTGNNQALFVVDGVPISNAITNTADQRTGRGGYDFGNAAMDINPEDIESISIMKGAAASALYGARAANGVVLITTKKGSKGEELGVTVNTGLKMGQIDKTTMPRYQTQYGQGYTTYDYTDILGSSFYDPDTEVYGLENIDINEDGNAGLGVVMYEDGSFGPEYDPNRQVYDWRSVYPELSTYNQTFPYQAATNLPTEFYKSSITTNNNISVNGGTENASFRLSYTNYFTTGVLPNSELKKNTISLNAGYDVADDWNVGVNMNFVNQNAVGRFGTGYDNNNVNQSFRQWYGTNIDIYDQRDAYEQTGDNISWNPFGQLDPSSMTQPHYFDNYYYVRHENYTTDGRSRLFGNVHTTYDITDNLKLTGRISMDTYDEFQDERIAKQSVDVSKYERYNRSYREMNYDAFLTYNDYFGGGDAIGFTGLLGTNVRRVNLSDIRAQTNGGIGIAGVYSLSNSVLPMEAPTENVYSRGLNGYFARASFDFNRFIYLDVTGRYDISSTLPEGNNSYFYPSASLSFVLSEVINWESLSYAKLRFSYAQVGNDAPAQSLTDYYVLNTPIRGTGLGSYPSTENNPDLKPEITSNFEAGIDLRFFENRLRLDVSAYQSETENLITPVDLSPSTGLYRKFFNAGSIQNRGVEVTAGFTPVRNQDFTWDIDVNWSVNRNEVLELYEGLERLELASVQGGISIVAEPGKPYGTILGTNYQTTDEGEKIVVPHFNSGVRYATTSTPEDIGNIQADWRGGIMNSLSYKGVNLSFLIDIQQGGQFFSLDTWYGYATGLYDFTAGTNDKGNPVRARPEDGGGKPIGGVIQNQDGEYVENTEYGYAGDVYSAFGYVYAPNAYHVNDASFVKLREVSLGYSFPMNSNVFKGIDVSLVGRNLWIIHKNSEYSDPEAGLSAGNIQGYQSGAYPAVKEYGVNLQLKF